jgi:hypothetical protein
LFVLSRQSFKSKHFLKIGSCALLVLKILLIGKLLAVVGSLLLLCIQGNPFLNV